MTASKTWPLLALGLLACACRTSRSLPPPPAIVVAVEEPTNDARLVRDPGPRVDPNAEEKTRLRRDQLHIRGGAQFLGNFATEISVNGQTLGTDIDLEDDLGFDSDVFTGRVDFDWRLGQRHHVIGSWYAIERDSTLTIDEEISFEDVVFQIGAEVTGVMNLDVVRFGYRYDFWQDRRTEAGLSIGAHTLVADFQFSGMAEVNGMGPIVDVTRSAKATAPLPVVGTYLNWAVAKKWTMYMTAEFFAVKFDQFEGALIDNQLVLEYAIADNVGLGLGYNRFLIDMNMTEDSFRGDLEYTYNGLLFFLSAWI